MGKEFYQALLDPKGKLGIWGIATVILVGILLMIVPGFLGGNAETALPREQLREIKEFGLEEALSKQAEEILSQVQGIGNVAVFVFAQGRSDPIILKEKEPQIKGVLVVAEGAGNVAIKGQLSKTVQSLFALPAHRVMILPMKGR